MGKSTATIRGEIPSRSITRRDDATRLHRRRNSIRLKGFDYSQPGEYFVTVCTADRRHIFGDVMCGCIQLSAMGKIVDECWYMIPHHFPNTKVNVFQIMPDHVHGIIQIQEKPVGVEYIQPLQNDKGKQSQFLPRRGVQLNAPTEDHFSVVSPEKGTLSVIIRTFKGAVISELRKAGKYPDDSIWQRSFYDHIIRDEIDKYFVEQYIALNPMIWELSRGKMSVEAVRNILKEKHGLDDYAIDRVIELMDTY